MLLWGCKSSRSLVSYLAILDVSDSSGHLRHYQTHELGQLNHTLPAAWHWRSLLRTCEHGVGLRLGNLKCWCTSSSWDKGLITSSCPVLEECSAWIFAELTSHVDREFNMGVEESWFSLPGPSRQRSYTVKFLRLPWHLPQYLLNAVFLFWMPCHLCHINWTLSLRFVPRDSALQGIDTARATHKGTVVWASLACLVSAWVQTFYPGIMQAHLQLEKEDSPLCALRSAPVLMCTFMCCRGTALRKLGDGISWAFGDAWQEPEVNPGAKKPSDPSPSPAPSARSPTKWRCATFSVLPISSTLLRSLCSVFTSRGCILS